MQTDHAVHPRNTTIARLSLLAHTATTIQQHIEEMEALRPNG
jgi:hypothetical protein